MAINSIGQDSSVYGDYKTTEEVVKDKTELSNDDFMTLLLVELQNQDPTEPMDSDKILSQTSQLATLESTDKTNKALEDLATSLASSKDFSTIAAIGKTADLGSNAITMEKGSNSTFEIYFPSDIASGTVDITDAEGRIVKSLEVGTNPSGVYQFTWDGTDNGGSSVDEGIYYVTAAYSNEAGDSLKTRMGTYPIESVKFDKGDTLLKLGTNYVSLENVKEIF